MIDAALAILIRNALGDTIAEKSQVRPSSEVSNVITDPLPLITYTPIDLKRQYSDSGNTGMPTAIYNVDIYTNKGSDARSIADQIRVALDGYRGTTSEVSIDRIYFGREKLLQGSLREGSNQTLARYAMETFITYRERTS